MTYIQWHLKIGLPQIFRTSITFIENLFHFFAFRELLTHLFSPWKKQALKAEKPGFDLHEFFYDLSFNLISRAIGFVLRLSALLVGLIFTLVLIPLILIFAIIFALPPLLYPFYARYRLTHPPYQGKSVTEQLKLFQKSPLAKHLLYRTGIAAKDFHSILPTATHSLSSLIPPDSPSPRHSDILLHLYDQSPPLREFFSTHSLQKSDLINLITWHHQEMDFELLNTRYWRKNYLFTHYHPFYHWSVGYTPLLDRFSSDITTPSTQYPLIGRDEELNLLIRGLSRSHQPHVIISGESGSGRLSLVEALATAIHSHRARSLNHHRLLLFQTDVFLSQTNPTSIAHDFGFLLREAIHADRIILIIPNFIELLSSEKSGYSITTTFADKLDQNHVRLIGITNPKDFHTLQKQDTIQKYFTTINLEALDPHTTLQILFSRVTQIEDSDLQVTYFSLRRLLDLSSVYAPDDPFPEKSLDLLEEVITYAREHKSATITPEVVETVVSAHTPIPVSNATETERHTLLQLESTLAQSISGQDLALKAIATALRRNRTELSSTSKPIGSFLFLGPTGVGKTETAKILNDLYFPDTELIRLDMAEFQTADGLEKLIGTIHSDNEGILVDRLLKNPYGLLLLDEFEKSTLAVKQLFLSILDEGFFTSASGKKVDCTHLIIIATSNAGSEQIRQYLSDHPVDDQFQSTMLEFILQANLFSPELLNRFDAVVFYHPLGNEAVRAITQTLITNLAQRLKRTKNLTLKVSDATLDAIVSKGYNPDFGIRSIQHYLKSTLEDDIAKAILQNPDQTHLTL